MMKNNKSLFHVLFFAAEKGHDKLTAYLNGPFAAYCESLCWSMLKNPNPINAAFCMFRLAHHIGKAIQPLAFEVALRNGSNVDRMVASQIGAYLKPKRSWKNFPRFVRAMLFLMGCLTYSMVAGAIVLAGAHR